MTIGTRIKNLRKGLNYSQEYIAEQLDVSRQAVSKWEKDLSSPSTDNIIQLAKLLNSTVEYIASGKKEEAEVNYVRNEKWVFGLKCIWVIKMIYNHKELKEKYKSDYQEFNIKNNNALLKGLVLEIKNGYEVGD